ncbi:MAG: hypothetical protein NWE84_03175 [Candidatus Bathyarchaeota archaeon]|nr:hypothetical protein [Candidatus Bathyarchaeota archaeon]
MAKAEVMITHTDILVFQLKVNSSKWHSGRIMFLVVWSLDFIIGKWDKPLFLTKTLVMNNAPAYDLRAYSAVLVRGFLQT